MKETIRGIETAIVYDHQTHQHKGLIRELMIERIVTDMATVADMATETGMEIIKGVVIDREVTDMVMAATNGVLVLRGCGVARTSSKGNKNNKPQATSGRVFALTTEQETNAP
nr:hypothetical protein [Tanacetum cinerariifolium]